MKTQAIIKSLCAGILASVLSASAGILSLPTPGPSEYPDAESSLCVQLDPSRGPLMRLQLAADFTPSNAVIVAFGTDANADGDLSPEETAGRVGVDCGEWRSDLLIASTEESTHRSTTTTTNYNFVLKQPSDVSRRYDLAKVTAHNLTSTNLVVTLSRIVPRQTASPAGRFPSMPLHQS